MNYETRKNLWLIAVALLFAALAATLATRWMKSRVAATDASNKNFASIVVTARDVPMGKRLEAADLRLVSTAKQGVPVDAYHRTEEVVGQVSRSPFYAGEMLIQRRLSQYSGGSALAAVVAPDMRAVTVRVDDVIGVGGFILPENRVDVIAAFHDGSGSHAETILRDARVLAVDQRSNPESDGPLLVRAVTLEVTPLDAEKIAAARQNGTIQLTLRNPLSKALPDPVAQETVARAAPTVIVASAPAFRVSNGDSRPRAAPPTVTLIRGTQVITRSPE
jgi:pilus assembly protein CpaB